MEELHSTEMLDREILEDARKKAFKILKTSDDNVLSQAKRWESKTQRIITKINKAWDEKTLQMRAEVLTRGPLDRRRLRSETADFMLRQAMDEFLHSLKHEDLIAVLEQELGEKLSQCAEGEISRDEEPEFSCRNLSKNEAENILRKLLKDNDVGKVSGFNNWKINMTDNGVSVFPEIIIKTHNMRISVSVENTAYRLLDVKRAELASSLLGEGALND